jgi:glycosyltransferase involved in cell wall biosynthesis
MWKENITVSVIIITYNHENFIQEAIESVLSQKTNFIIELIIGEDNSTDKTRSICKEYADRFPEIIRLLDSKKNLGMIKNFIRTITSGQGKYLAICEGDDYWTDTLKLQKQVDFLEANPEYVVCFHRAKVKNEIAEHQTWEYPEFSQDRSFSLKEFIQYNPFPTASALFIKDYVKSIPGWFIDLPFGDMGLYILLLFKSGLKARYLNYEMSVYRIHKGSIHSSLTLQQQHLVFEKHYTFLTIIKKNLFNKEFEFEISSSIKYYLKKILEHSSIRNFKFYLKYKIIYTYYCLILKNKPNYKYYFKLRKLLFYPYYIFKK